MCFTPIKIPNPSRLVDPNCFKPFIEVPCGHCPACAKNKQNDAEIRSYYEYKMATGFTYFDTLTYNEENVPRFRGERVFSRKDITDFLKRIRKNLSDRGYDVKTKLRYFLVCEYGGLKHRPHYHIMWFCSVPNLSPQELWAITRKTWKKGFNDPKSCIFKHIVNSNAALNYVTKYVTKDTEFIQIIRRLFAHAEADPKQIKEIYENLTNIIPFMRSSLFFGFSMLLSNDVNDMLEYGVPYFDKQGKKFHRMPNYIKRKLFYDKFYDERIPVRNYNPLSKNSELPGYSMRLTPLGVEYKCSILDDSIKNFELSIDYLFSSARAYDIPIEFEVDRTRLHDYAIYKLVFQGHMMPDNYNVYSDVPDYHLFYRDCISTHLKHKLSNSPIAHKREAKKWLSANERYIIGEHTFPSWQGFDELTDNLNNLSTQVNEIRLDSSKIESKLKLKQRLIHEMYFPNN